MPRPASRSGMGYNRRMFAKNRAYLDWAAATPPSAAALRAFAHASCAYGNPSSPHREGRDARVILEDARVRIARVLAAKADDVVFTSGATEANALAVAGHVEALLSSGRAERDIHLLYLPSAHASVIHTIEALRLRGVAVEPLPIAAPGVVDTARLAAMVRATTALVSMDVVCGETGVVWNTRAVAEMLREHAATRATARVLLHADAAQAPFAESCERTRIGADLVSLDAQKIGGVRGIGVLVASRTVALSPLIRGGGQERELRSGTQSPALASAFAAALTEASRGREAFAARAAAARAALILRLSRDIPRVLVNQGKRQAPHILNVSVPGADTDYLCALLDEAGFAAATRSACETDAEGSRAVFALFGDAERARATLRVSWGPRTKARELERFSDALARAVRFVDKMPS